MLRALLFLLAAAPFLTATAHAQTGGIQVAPVLISMSPERSISSLRLRNGRDRPVAFEIDAYAWRQENGRDVLTPTGALIVAPGVFEIPAHGEQVVRLGLDPATRSNGEQAYRIIMRELPTPHRNGAVLGFTLEMSLPVFVTPQGAQAQLQARVDGGALRLANTGSTFLQISAIEDADAGALDGPRYLLAGASAVISLPPRARRIRVRGADVAGAQTERIVDVSRQDHIASVR